MTPVRRIVTEHRRLIWPIAGALLLNVALLGLVVYPFSKNVAGGSEEARAAAAQLDAARRDNAAAKATVTGKQQADAELRRFYEEVLPPDMSGARRITYGFVHDLADESKLQMQRENFESSSDRESTLQKLTMTAVLSGDYTNIRRFIHQLETAPEFLVLEDVALAQQQDRPGITLTAKVATYYRTGGNGN